MCTLWFILKINCTSAPPRRNDIFLELSRARSAFPRDERKVLETSYIQGDSETDAIVYVARIFRRRQQIEIKQIKGRVERVTHANWPVDTWLWTFKSGKNTCPPTTGNNFSFNCDLELPSTYNSRNITIMFNCLR